MAILTDLVNTLLPVALPAVASAAVAFFRANILSKVPSKWLPMVMNVGGAVMGTFGKMYAPGVEGITMTGLSQGAVQGLLVALAANGIHQLVKQTAKPV